MVASSPLDAKQAPLPKNANMRTIGVLALQGAFEEHVASFERLPEELMQQVEIVQVRKGDELDDCDAIVIPGGESTTMKIIAGCDNFMELLRSYVHGGAGADGRHRPPRPVWGTCAGCILLSDNVINQQAEFGEEAAKRCKYGDPVGGLPVETCRNFFGRQAESFEASLIAPALAQDEQNARRCEAFSNFPAVFIRAPAILRIGAGARVLARVHHPKLTDEGEEGIAVAAESGQILVTCFHPELAQDSRIHRYFVEQFVLRSAATGSSDGNCSASGTSAA
mmetsp:Transcript_92524/g.178368  ORF Transcript_92524/g.178368 Transcript_92524/m.178368 type:complete len:280 (+) Transcript_92524:74-913(+)